MSISRNSLNMIGLDKCPNCGRVVAMDELISLTSTTAMCETCNEDAAYIEEKDNAKHQAFIDEAAKIDTNAPRIPTGGYPQPKITMVSTPTSNKNPFYEHLFGKVG